MHILINYIITFLQYHPLISAKDNGESNPGEADSLHNEIISFAENQDPVR